MPWLLEVGGQQTFAISGDLMSTFGNLCPVLQPRDKTKPPKILLLLILTSITNSSMQQLTINSI